MENQAITYLTDLVYFQVHSTFIFIVLGATLKYDFLITNLLILFKCIMFSSHGKKIICRILQLFKSIVLV